jgi:hypothetical protein
MTSNHHLRLAHWQPSIREAAYLPKMVAYISYVYYSLVINTVAPSSFVKKINI